MEHSNDLVDIERRAYQTIWDDGLLDVFVGACIVAVAVFWVIGEAVWGAILPALLVPVWQSVRKRIVEPRTGYVEFSRERTDREKKGLWLMALLSVLTLALGISVFFVTRANPRELDNLVPTVIPALPAVLLGLGSVLVGLVFGIQRFVGYGALLFVGAAVGAFLRAGPGWHFLVPGVLILIVGLILLTSFLRKYPMAEVESLS